MSVNRRNCSPWWSSICNVEGAVYLLATAAALTLLVVNSCYDALYYVDGDGNKSCKATEAIEVHHL